MQVIDAFDSYETVRSVAASPDGRFLAATASFAVTLIDWQTGQIINTVTTATPVGQMVFTADGKWLVFAFAEGLFRIATTPGATAIRISPGAFAGGVAIAPSGTTLIATTRGFRQSARLLRWELPSWQSISGFDFWSPFQRLAISPNGAFVAGIAPDTFELRFAISGGLSGRHLVRYVGEGFLAFPRDSRTVLFGWESDLYGMETHAGGTVLRASSPGAAFVDAAFLGNGYHLATADSTSMLRVWSAESWQVVREYDWAVGEITCLAAATDGLSCVCGTDSGRLVLFDVDD